MKSLRATFENKLETLLDDIEERIGKIQSRAEATGTTVNSEYRQLLDRIGSAMEDARTRLERLREVDDDQWGNLKAEIDTLVSELTKLRDEAASAVKSSDREDTEFY